MVQDLWKMLFGNLIHGGRIRRKRSFIKILSALASTNALGGPWKGHVKTTLITWRGHVVDAVIAAMAWNHCHLPPQNLMCTMVQY
jgi:hypothetical protein